MAHVLVKLLDADQVSFDDIEGLTPIKESPVLHEWRGRFWLPEGDRVDPARKHCLMGDDGRDDGSVMDQFIASKGADYKKNSLALPVFLTK